MKCSLIMDKPVTPRGTVNPPLFQSSHIQSLLVLKQSCSTLVRSAFLDTKIIVRVDGLENRSTAHYPFKK